MAQLINEAKRMQQLAGIKKNNLNEEETQQTAPQTAQTNIVNTSDEMLLQKAIESLPTLKARLNNINNVTELDGFFKILMSNTALNNQSKSSIIQSLTKALKDLEPESSSITTKVK
jgi:hypothetical protein